MASIFRQATSWLYTSLAVSILGTWSLFVLFFVSVTALDSDPGLLQLIAMPSLLTFLVAKLIVAASSSSPTSRANLATWLASADNGSPHGALVLFLLSVTWLLQLARVVFAMFVMVLIGGVFALTSALDLASKEVEEDGQTAAGFDERKENLTTALVELEQKVGFQFGEALLENPWMLFQIVAAMWAVLALLMMYITGYSFGALRKVLTTPMEAWSRTPAPAVEDAPRSTATAVVVEKDRVVIPAGVQAAS